MTAPANTFVDINGIRISLRRAGAGETVLYLHGGDGAGTLAPRMDTWSPFHDHLAERFDVIAPEHPGFGESDLPDWLANIHDMTYFYLDFLDEMDLDGVHLVGQAVGGWIALELAVRSHHRLKSLTVINTAGIHLKGVAKGDMFMWAPEDVFRTMILDQDLAEELLALEETQEEEDLRIRARYALARIAWQPPFFDPHLEKWLHRVKLPTHIVWSADNRMFPVDYAHALAGLITDARVTILPQCGHLAHIEKPEALAELVTGFVEEVGP
jgi:pimeloyl-ACP methyl ester carboxylesterase